MTARRFILAVLCLCGGICFAAVSCLEAEDALRRTLVDRGIRLGHDAESGVCTVIASASKKGAQPFACFRMAELKALHQILNMRSQTMSGATIVRRDEAAKTVRSFVETLSQADLDGCLLVDFCGRQDGDGWVVAVAMCWSEDLESRARASASGALRPAYSWVDELKKLVDGCDGELLPPTLSFVDSKGFFHRAGVGVARVGGESSLQRDAAAREADLLARKNLQLALYGRAAMRKKAELMKSSDRLNGAESLSSAYEALGEVSAEGPLPAGSRSVHDKVVQTEDGSKVFVVVYGVVPGKTGGTGQPVPEAASGDVLIWNPRTGKFEKTAKGEAE